MKRHRPDFIYLRDDPDLLPLLDDPSSGASKQNPLSASREAIAAERAFGNLRERRCRLLPSSPEIKDPGVAPGLLS